MIEDICMEQLALFAGSLAAFFREFVSQGWQEQSSMDGFMRLPEEPGKRPGAPAVRTISPGA